LSEERLLDLLAGEQASGREHLLECAHCHARLEDARQALRLAREAEVPEPSPLYWETFRRRVGRRIVVDEPSPGAWRLPAFAALAALIAALSLLPAPRTRPGASPGPPLPAWSALPASEDDAGFALIEGLATGALDLATAADCGGVAECLAGLSDAESQALVEVLRRELARRDS
jgi:hypothetical protein